MKKIKIFNTEIGNKNKCFIIAEAGVNHNGNVEKAKELIDIAKDAGADVVKFQTWVTEEIVTKDAKTCEYQKNNTSEENQFEMIKKLELSFDDFNILKKYADEKEIIFMSTPDDEISVDFLFKLGVPAFKIGSGELTNYSLLKKISLKKLPIILSTGMATLKEVEEAVNVIKDNKNNKIILLHCTSNYPADIMTANLLAMKTMEEKTSLLTGYSDHTEGIEISLIAALLGAKIIEKHFTYDKTAKGPDHKASLNPDELKNLVNEIRRIETLSEKERANELKLKKNIKIILGDGQKKAQKSEISTRKLVRKSIVSGQEIKKGTVLKEKMFKMKRPGTGLNPKEIKNIIGKFAKKDILYDEIITYKLISDKKLEK